MAEVAHAPVTRSNVDLPLAGLVVLFAFGALASGISVITLSFPGTALDLLWRVNPKGHAGLLASRPWSVLLMLGVCVACAAAARGIMIRARWGRRLGLIILSINILGDTANALFLGDLRTLIGIPIGGALVYYLLTPGVKAAFTR